MVEVAMLSYCLYRNANSQVSEPVTTGRSGRALLLTCPGSMSTHHGAKLLAELDLSLSKGQAPVMRRLLYVWSWPSFG